jgi:acetyltransferase
VALPPLNASLAQDLVQRSQLGKMLGGYRGKPAANQAALLDTLLKVSLLACDLAQVAELDINPLLIDADGVLAVDSRVRIKASTARDGAHLAIRPYPAALEEPIHVADRDVLLRPIRPDDGGLLQSFYADATPADMRLRFFMLRREVPHSELARYSQIDYDREMTFVALSDSASGVPRMLGEVRAVCDPDNIRAEFAIQVATRWQGRGLGRLLLDKLLRYLRARGTQEVVGECMLENLKLAALARHAGFDVNPGSSVDIVSLRLQLNPPALEKS